MSPARAIVHRSAGIWMHSNRPGRGLMNLRLVRHCSTPTDAELQKKFDSFGNKVNMLVQLVMDVSKMEEVVKLQAKKVLPNEDLPEAVRLYIELQNPLLKRYGIKVDDILSGAKQACGAIMLAAGSIDPGNTDAASSPSREFLADAVSPPLLSAIEQTLQQRYAKGYRSVVRELEVLEVSLVDIRTKVVPEPSEAGPQLMDVLQDKIIPTLTQALVPVAETAQLPASARDTSVGVHKTASQSGASPPGSVEATVEVRCGLRATNEVLCWDPTTTEGVSAVTSEEVKVYKHATQVFRACISGHVPMEWRLVSTDGIIFGAARI